MKSRVLPALFSLLLAVLVPACAPADPPNSFQGIANTPATQQPILVRPNQARPPIPATSTPSVRAESVVVMDMLSGRILYQKNARSPRAVASTQKLLTALVVANDGSLSDPVEVQSSDTRVEPSKIYIKAGEKYTRRDLLKALIVKSGNDVARALARDVAGSQEAFAARMNSTARSIGMQQSNFKNPHGLTEEGQFSTAMDIAILARKVYQNPTFRQWMKTREYVFQFPDGRTKTLTNTNKILKRLPYCTGMKTGTTRASGRCLVSSGVLNGKAVISVALGSTSEQIWNDSEKLLRWALE